MKRLIPVLMICFASVSAFQAEAQCSICTKTAQQMGHKPAKDLSSGILYLMAVPYVMGGVAGLIWWKYRKGEPPQV